MNNTGFIINLLQKRFGLQYKIDFEQFSLSSLAGIVLFKDIPISTIFPIVSTIAIAEVAILHAITIVGGASRSTIDFAPPSKIIILKRRQQWHP